MILAVGGAHRLPLRVVVATLTPIEVLMTNQSYIKYQSGIVERAMLRADGVLCFLVASISDWCSSRSHYRTPGTLSCPDLWSARNHDTERVWEVGRKFVLRSDKKCGCDGHGFLLRMLVFDPGV